MLVERAKAILLQPKSEWPVIAAEPATVKSIYIGYVVILAAVPAVCGALGLLIAGYITPMKAIEMMVLQYALGLFGVYALALIIDALAPQFGGQKDAVQALKVAAYSSTAAWLAGVFALLPPLAVLGILGLYSLYLLYLGLPVLMKAPQDRAIAYTGVVIVAAIVVFIVVDRVTIWATRYS
jgi:Yip1-like protein